MFSSVFFRVESFRYPARQENLPQPIPARLCNWQFSKKMVGSADNGPGCRQATSVGKGRAVEGGNPWENPVGRPMVIFTLS